MIFLSKLNIGCGIDIKEGYINIDVRLLPGVNIIADVFNLPFKDNSISEIYACDVYEHISHRKSKELLKHWVNKLKKGGLLFIQTTNLLSLIDYILKSNKIEDAVSRIFGGQDYPENTHLTSGHPVILEKYLRDSGITGEIKFEYKFGNMTNLRCRSIK